MPKLPGRESTAKTIRVELAMIANFVPPWDVHDKPCCIKGCSHRCSGRTDGSTGFEPFEPCSRNNAASIYDERKMPGPVPDPYVGNACPCCVDRIIDRDS